MATPTVREVLSAAQSGAPATVVTDPGTQADDLLVTFHGSNYYDIANWPGPPTGTAGTWQEQASGDAGVNDAHLKAYTRPVAVGGAQTITVSPINNEEVYQITYVIAGDNLQVDDAAGGASPTADTSLAAPSVSPGGTDDLLLCAWQTGAPSASVDFTAPPSGMSGLLEVEDPIFSTLGSARQALAAGGPTGTRSATINAARAYAAISLAITSTGGAATVTGAAALSASSGAAAQARVVVRAAATLAAAGALSIAARVRVAGAAPMSAAAALTAVSRNRVTAAAALSESGILVAAGTARALAAAALSAAGTLAASGVSVRLGSAALSAQGSMSIASGATQGQATLSAAGTLSAAATVRHLARTDLNGAAELTAAARVRVLAAVQLTASAGLSATSRDLTSPGVMALAYRRGTASSTGARTGSAAAATDRTGAAMTTTGRHGAQMEGS